MLADEPFAKALRILENFVSVNNTLCGKLVSSLLQDIFASARPHRVHNKKIFTIEGSTLFALRKTK